jgi:hypothetical protein
MRRGTTPTLTFTTPYAADLIQSGYISFMQRGEDVLDISLTDPAVTIEDESISVDLTQEQTLLFTTADTVKMQIRAKLTSGKAVASNIVEDCVCPILKEGEI